MFCGNYILSNGSRWTFYFSKVFNLILQSANKLSFRNREVKLIFLIAIPNTLNDDLVNATSRVYDLIELISRNSVLYSNFLKYDNSKKLGQIAEGV